MTFDDLVYMETHSKLARLAEPDMLSMMIYSHDVYSLVYCSCVTDGILKCYLMISNRATGVVTHDTALKYFRLFIHDTAAHSIRLPHGSVCYRWVAG